MYVGLGENIAKKFREYGFGAKQLGSGVSVWLNREISTIEVENLLEELFQGNYKVTRIAKNQVMIEEE